MLKGDWICSLVELMLLQLCAPGLTKWGWTCITRRPLHKYMYITRVYPQSWPHNNTDRHDQVSHQHKDHQCLIFFPADYSEDLIVGDVWRCVCIPAEAQLRHLDTQKLPLYPNLSSYWHWACEPQWLQVHISCCYRGPYSPSPPPPFSPSPAPTPHYRSQIICPWTHRPSVVWSWILTLPKFLTPRDTYTQRNSHAHTSSRWLFPRPCDLSRRYLGVSSPLKASCSVALKNTVPFQLPGHVTYSLALELQSLIFWLLKTKIIFTTCTYSPSLCLIYMWQGKNCHHQNKTWKKISFCSRF